MKERRLTTALGAACAAHAIVLIVLVVARPSGPSVRALEGESAVELRRRAGSTPTFIHFDEFELAALVSEPSQAGAISRSPAEDAPAAVRVRAAIANGAATRLASSAGTHREGEQPSNGGALAGEGFAEGRTGGGTSPASEGWSF